MERQILLLAGKILVLWRVCQPRTPVLDGKRDFFDLYNLKN
jgi:hypothetical protein